MSAYVFQMELYVRQEAQRPDVEDASGRRLLLLQWLRRKLCNSRLEAAEKTPGIFTVGAEKEGGADASVRPAGRYWPQVLAALFATLLSMSGGCNISWSAPALPLLEVRLNQSSMRLTEEQTSWISSLLPLGALVGVLPSGYLANTFGRKRVMLTLVAPYITGWILVAVDVLQLPLIYAGRFICGVCMGASSCLVPMYLEEIAQVSLRGVLGVLFHTIANTGMLWSYVVAMYLTYEGLAVACALLPVIFAASFCWMPESPVHLLTSRGDAAAEASLQWLRGRTDVHAELCQLKRDVDSHHGASSQSVRPAAKLAAIVAGLKMFHQLSGVNAVMFYVVTIFHESGGSLSPIKSAVVVGVAQVMATAVAGSLVEVLGRRVLLVSSGVISSLCHGILAVYFYLQSAGWCLDNVRWLPLATLVAFITVITLGLGSLSWLIIAELVPVEARGWAGPLAGSVNWLSLFVVTVFFPHIQAVLGPTVVFAFFALSCAASVVFALLCLPETKGKTREEIRNMLVARK